MTAGGLQRELDLHTGWEFRETGSSRWRPAVVPGCVHLDLHRNGEIPDPFWADTEHRVRWIEERGWVYRLAFEIPAGWLAHERVDLVAEGLDTLATIRLNGVRVASTENMFVCHRFPVKGRLRPGENQLEVEFAPVPPFLRARRRKDHFPEFNDPVGGRSLIRKEQCSFGWDWGPRFVTCGIYRRIFLHGWSGNRIETVRVRQEHSRGKARIYAEPVLARPTRRAEARVRLELRGRPVASSDSGGALEAARPELWWPNDWGDQPLYDLTVDVFQDGRAVDVWRRRIGLRTIRLDRPRDASGRGFRFVVNGVPIFAKGANWIPAHSFVAGLGRDDYRAPIADAADAHMNMLRVWGGGVYESEDFYDLCDEKGLLVWQDFMFACALYPGDRRFLASVAEEARHQVRRLAHRACLALWCGNNEIELIPDEIRKTRRRRENYRKLFYKALPDAVRRHDGATDYLPSSPHHPKGTTPPATDEQGVDAHFWAVWAERAPVTDYADTRFRFVSEFGMQSFSSEEVARRFCPPEELDPFSPAMESRQKCKHGNRLVLDYVFRRYRYAKNYSMLAYLTELNQAHAVGFAVEHFRRSMPENMGALYWQLNDCWPGFSWSGIEFGGRWKALQYHARRFFAPVMISAWVPGQNVFEESPWPVSPPARVELHGVNDGRRPAATRWIWELFDLSGELADSGGGEARLKPGRAKRLKSLDFSKEIRQRGADRLALRVRMESDDGNRSEQTVLFVAPRRLRLKDAPIHFDFDERSRDRVRLRLRSSVYHHQVALRLEGGGGKFSDNYFDLFPNEPVELEAADEAVGGTNGKKLRDRILAHSLVHASISGVAP